MQKTRKQENKKHIFRTLVHLCVLQHVCREYDRQNPKNEKAKQILSAFSAGVTGDLYTCQTCKQIFGSSRELKLHSAKDHDSFNLSRAFASNSRRDATGKVCGKLNFYLKYCVHDMFSRFLFSINTTLQTVNDVPGKDPLVRPPRWVQRGLRGLSR